MKKIILIVILLAAVVYLGSKIYILNTRNQSAQVSGGQSITAGTLQTTSIQAGLTVLFSLTTANPLSNDEIPSMYLELVSPGKRSYVTKVSSSGNTTVLSAQIPYDTTAKTEYTVKVVSGSLQWTFAELLTVTSAPTTGPVNLPYATQTENESEVTGFSISPTQPNPKDVTLNKIAWTGAGRGVTAWKITGTGATSIKQLVYQTAYPVESAGYRVTSPFTYINLDGFGAAGSSDAVLINTSSKTVELQVTFTPRGKDNSVVPGYGKTVTFKIPPTVFALTRSDKNKLRAGDVTNMTVKSIWPITDLFAPLRKSPEVELKLAKLNKTNVYTMLEVPEFKTDNTFSISIPKELNVYKNVLGKFEKSGVESVTPGKYRLSLKTVFGIANYDFEIVK